MKSELSAMDMHYLVKEFQVLIDGKIDKIYEGEEDRKDFLFRFHVPGKGKISLRVHLPNLIYITECKGDFPEQPPGFCMFLRKYLQNARVRKIEQVGFERILKFTFEHKVNEKVETYYLIVELFSKGNMILCDSTMKIKSPLESQSWADRTIRGNTPYLLPPAATDTLNLNLEEFSTMVRMTKMDSIVKCLAVDLALGGLYAEELLCLVDIDKNMKKLSKEDIGRLYDELHILKDKEVKAVKVGEEILPFPFKSIPETGQSYPSFSAVLDDGLSGKERVVKEKKEKATKKDKIMFIINEQENKIKGFEKQAVESQKKGELIYENYTLVKEILQELKKAREKHTWKEIKERLKGHKIIKEIDEKEGKVVVEL
ncbi:MAG: NFACT family protein [Nanoarchaeota archaeon]